MLGPKRSKAGFSFVELIIATMIVIVVTVGAFRLISRVSSGRTQLYLSTRAKNLIDAELALTRGLSTAFWESMTSPNNAPEDRTPPGESQIGVTRLVKPIIFDRNDPHFNLRYVEIVAKWVTHTPGGLLPKERKLTTWIGPSRAEVPGANIIGVIVRHDDPSIGIENVTVSCPGQETSTVFAHSGPSGHFRISGVRVNEDGVYLTVDGERRRCYFLPGEGANTAEHPNDIASFARELQTKQTDPGGVVNMSSITVHPPGLIQGVVKDQNTNAPLPGITMAIYPSMQVISNFTRTNGDKYATTNSKGEYLFVDVIPGRYWIQNFGNSEYAAKSWVDDYDWKVYQNDFQLDSGQIVTVDSDHPVNWGARKTNVHGHITPVDWDSGSQRYVVSHSPVAEDINISMYYSNSSVIITNTGEEVSTYNTRSYRKFLADVWGEWFLEDNTHFDWWEWFSGGPKIARTNADGDYTFESLGPNIINSTHTAQDSPPMINQQEIDIQFGTGGRGVRYPFTPVVVFAPEGGGDTFESGINRDQIRMMATGFGSYRKTYPEDAIDDADVVDFMTKRLRIDAPELTYHAYLLKYSALNYAWGDVKWAWAAQDDNSDGVGDGQWHDPGDDNIDEDNDSPGEFGINGFISVSFKDAPANSLGAVNMWFDNENKFGGNQKWMYWGYSGGAVSNGKTFSTKYKPWGQNNYYNSLIPTQSDDQAVQLSFIGTGPEQVANDKIVIRVRAYDKYAEVFEGRTYIWLRELDPSEVDLPQLPLQIWRNAGVNNRYLVADGNYDIENGSSTLSPPPTFSAKRFDIYHSTPTDNNGSEVNGKNQAIIPPPYFNSDQENPNKATIYVNPQAIYQWHVPYEIRMEPPWDKGEPNESHFRYFFYPNEFTIGHPAVFNATADWGNGEPGAGGGYECTLPVLRVGEAHFRGRVVDTSGRRLNGSLDEEGRRAPQAQITITSTEFPNRTIYAEPVGDFDFDFHVKFVPFAGTNVRIRISCPGFQDAKWEGETWDGFGDPDGYDPGFTMYLLGVQPSKRGDL